MSIATLPKIELHLNLEGAAPPEFIARLAKEKSIDIAGIFGPDGQYNYRDFWRFIDIYHTICGTLRRPEDYRRLVLAVLEQQAESGVVYTELAISPDFCGKRDLVAWHEYLHAIREASAEAERRLGIVSRGVVTSIRHFGPIAARAAARCAAETAGDWVCGFGLAGDELTGQPKDFRWAFDLAREAGLRMKAHAGEWSGPETVRASIEDLGVERIGHGVRAIEDLALVDGLIERGIVLDLCPGSNVALGIYPSFRQHPIADLRKRGVRVTISTDDPGFFKTTMAREYGLLHDAFDWDEAEFADIARTSLDAAFCDADTKAKISAMLEAAHA